MKKEKLYRQICDLQTQLTTTREDADQLFQELNGLVELIHAARKAGWESRSEAWRALHEAADRISPPAPAEDAADVAAT